MEHRWLWSSVLSILILLKPEGYQSELVQLKPQNGTLLRHDPLRPYYTFDPAVKSANVPLNHPRSGWLPIPTPFYGPGGKKPGAHPPLLIKHEVPPGNGLGRPFGQRAMNFHGQQSQHPFPTVVGGHQQQQHPIVMGGPHLQRPPASVAPPPPSPPPTQPQGLKILRPSQPEPVPMASNQHENVVYRNHQQPLPYGPGPSSNTIEAQPPAEDGTKTSEEQSELRFLFHRPEDEDLIKSTIRDESEKYNERVSFVRGPTLKFHRRQTIYLPPRKKSVIYVMLKEPVVQTDLEVVEAAADPTPEVNIIYEKAGPVHTKHYYSTSDKHGGSVGSVAQQIGSGSEINSVTVVPPSSTSNVPPATQKLHTRSIPPASPCQPSFSKKLRKK